MTNKKTGFWIRLLARLLDLVVVSSIAVMMAFLMMDHNTSWTFKENYLFYIWALLLIIILFLWFIFIPSIWNGQTLFMWVLRIKIKFNNNNKLLSMIRRELFFSVSWIFILILLMIVINHSLIIAYSTSDQESINYTDGELLRVGIMTSISSIMILIQFICAISIFVRGPKKGLHDSQSNTWTVWTGKFISDVKEQKNNIRIVPKPVNNNPVEWVE